MGVDLHAALAVRDRRVPADVERGGPTTQPRKPPKYAAAPAPATTTIAMAT